MHLNAIRWWGGVIFLSSRDTVYLHFRYLGWFCSRLWAFLWSLVDSPALLLFSSHQFISVRSAPDISSHLKQACVLYGDGSGLLALDILVLCLLCCFTARYKAEIPCTTWGHNSRNVIIQRREAFSFLLIAPVMSLSCFCSLPVAA